MKNVVRKNKGTAVSSEKSKSPKSKSPKSKSPKRTPKKATKTQAKVSKVDPKKLERPITAYKFFAAAEANTNNPDTSFARYSKLTPEEQKPWKMKAAESRKQYQTAKADYSGPKIKKGPKKPERAFKYYWNENKDRISTEYLKGNSDAIKGESSEEIAKLVRVAFQALTPKGRKKYHNLANKDKTRYEKEFAAYSEDSQ